MKRILIFVFGLLFSFFLFVFKFHENTNLDNIQLKKDEFGILTFEVENQPYVLFLTKDQTVLLSNHKEIPVPVFKKLKKIGIFSFQPYFSFKNKTFGDIILKVQDGNVILPVKKNNFCIYRNNKIPKECQYVYFQKEGEYQHIQMAIYGNLVSASFKESFHQKQIDTYEIEQNEILYIKFFEDTYEVINISNHMIEARGFYG